MDLLSAIVLGLSLTVGLLGLYWLLTRGRRSAWLALAWSSVVAYFFWNWNAASNVTALPPVLITVSLFGIVLIGVREISEHPHLHIGLFAGSVTFMLALALIAIGNWIAQAEVVVGPQTELPTITLTSTPDVILIVLDGYGRSDVIDELYGYDNQEFERQLEESGFSVASLATSNYSITHLSIPALLNMSLMHPKNAVLGPTDLTALAESISGRNTVVRTFKDAGYRYVHGGWDSWLNRCGPQVDLCLSAGLVFSPPLDWWTVGPILERTPIGSSLNPNAGMAPITAVNLRRIDQLNNWNKVSEAWPEPPTFTFLHLSLPHPPMDLDSGCSVRVDKDLGGNNLYNENYNEETMRLRRSAWVEQLQCVNTTVLEFLRQVDPDDVIVITADHGPDSVFRLSDAGSLSPLQIRERFSVLTAVRLPDQCEPLPADVMTVNIFRHVFDCLSDDNVPPIEAGHFVAGFRGSVLERKYPNNG